MKIVLIPHLKIRLKGRKIRPMVVAYDIIESEVRAITIYPTSKQEIENKLERGRWIKNEDD